MIKICDVSKTFNGSVKVHAIKDVSLNVTAGEILGIIGLSGAGKSTLLRMINGLEVPDEGRIIIEGRDITSCDLKSLRKDIGMIFQHFNLLSSRNVLSNIMLPLEIAGVSKKDCILKAKDLLQKVGLSEKADSAISTLSGGQKQRVAIARALVNNPKILLCDEATSALDPITTNEVLELLRKLSKELNLTVVLITHEMSVVKKICDRVAVIDDGSIVEFGEVIDIFNQPQTTTAQSFVRAV